MERGAGALGLHLDLARRRAPGDRPRPDGLVPRARPALPPGHLRAGDGDGGRDVPGTLPVGGARQRPGAQRARDRRGLAGQGRPDGAAARVRRRDARAVGGRGGHASRPRRGRPRAAVVAARTSRRGSWPARSARRRRAGPPAGPTGCITVNQPAGHAAPHRRRLPRRRRPRGPAPPGPPRLRRPTTTRRSTSRTGSGARTACRRCSPGTSSSRPSSRPRPATCRARRWPRTSASPADLGRHAAWLREDLELGFDELYLHHVGQEQEAFIDAFGAGVLPELRAMRLTRTSDLWWKQAVVYCLDVQTFFDSDGDGVGRLRRPVAARRPPRRPRRRRDLADAVLPDRRRRRRLRHHGLLRRSTRGWAASATSRSSCGRRRTAGCA